MSMTWWSEHSAVPRFVLASSAIRCRFVDRFAGSRVPSRVSVQRFSARGAPLPSAGSRRARFPAFTGYIEALRLPARASGSLILFGCRSHALLHLFVLAEALRGRVEGASQAWNPCSAGVPILRLRARGRERDLTGSLAIRPMPLPCSWTPAEPARPRPLAVSSTPPSGLARRRPQRVENLGAASHGFSIRCLRFTRGVAAPHARLASGWRAPPLPGGRRTLWIATKSFRSHSHPPFQVLACR
jgi:hypothetical protein